MLTDTDYRRPEVGPPPSRYSFVPLLVRLVSQVTVWTCVLVPSVLVLARGWTPLGDNAAIEIRAYRALSLHPPLVGMYSTGSTGLGHTVFDPGPLAFWLLSVPVRLDQGHGLVWGAALLWGLCLSLAIESFWTARLWVGCGLIALVAVDLLWAAPFVLENPAWNAYLPLPFLIAACPAAYLVITGRFGWWPVLVFLASVAGQTHLLYLVGSAGLALLAPVLGLAVSGRPDRFRWLAVGLCMGLLCWIGPLVQALGRSSNVAALASSSGGTHHLGAGFGLRLLAGSAGGSPIWLHHTPTGFFPEMAFVYGHSTAYGVAGLLLLVAIPVIGLALKNPGLFACAAITCILGLGFVISFAAIPTSNLYVVGYLIVGMWLLGVLVWVSVAWCAGLLLTRYLAAKLPVGRIQLPTVVPTRVFGFTGLVLICAGSAVAIPRSFGARSNFGTNFTAQEARDARNVVGLVEQSRPPGPVNISIAGPGTDPVVYIAEAEGIGMRLLLDGWRPGLIGIDPAFSALPPRRHTPEMSIWVDGGQAIIRP
jgi:hypothetical protein